ncbi:MAG: hypothetical protein ABIR30_08180 [Chitinophagaceae bacterium]
MGRIFLYTIMIAVIFTACQKKALPVITERKEVPRGEVTNNSIAIAPDTVTGKSVFMARCGRCHGLPEPGQYSAGRWETILATMMPRARLNNEQKVHLSAWVKANAAR